MDERLVVQLRAVDADPLAQLLDEEAREPHGTQVKSPQQRVDHPRRGGHAVGAGQVDRAVGALRIAEQPGTNTRPGGWTRRSGSKC